MEVAVREPYYNYRLCGKLWGSDLGHNRIVALHGWLDNAGSFDLLAPILVDAGFCVLCIDQAGHGKSDHTGRYDYAHCVLDVYSFLEQFEWLDHPLYFIGHSYGGEYLCLFGGIWPELVRQTVFLDCFCPSPLIIHDKPDDYRKSILKTSKVRKRTLREFSSLQEAIDFRFSKLSKIASTITPTKLVISTTTPRSVKYEDGVWRFCYDLHANYDFSQGGMHPIVPTSSTLPITSRMNSPILLIGSKVSYGHWSKGNRANDLELHWNAFPNAKRIMLDASHHMHIDQVEQTSTYILDFFGTPNSHAKL